MTDAGYADDLQLYEVIPHCIALNKQWEALETIHIFEIRSHLHFKMQAFLKSKTERKRKER